VNGKALASAAGKFGFLGAAGEQVNIRSAVIGNDSGAIVIGY